MKTKSKQRVQGKIFILLAGVLLLCATKASAFNFNDIFEVKSMVGKVTDPQGNEG